MFDFTAQQIAELCSGKLIEGSPDAKANSCHIDSRQLLLGSLFAAFKGKQVDGHDYLEAAVEAGATILLISDAKARLALSEKPAVILVDDVLKALQDLASYQRSLISCPVIGITGSSGKTSTKELLKGALETGLQVIATEGNYNNELGVPLTLLRVTKDTEAVIVEMGMRGLGQITELTHIAQPTISIITTIGDAHIEMLGSRENIARAKGEIFEALSSEQLALMPLHVDFADYLRSICAAPVLTVALEQDAMPAEQTSAQNKQSADQPAKLTPPANYRAYIKSYDVQGNALSLVELPTGEKVEMRLEIPGEHSVQNALLALAVSQVLGLDPAEAIGGMEQVRPATMRMQRCAVNTLPQLENAHILVDCYNANPESTAAALKTLAVSELGDHQTGKRIAVLGDMLEMGEHAQAVHNDILLLAGLLNIDLVYTYGEHYGLATQHLLSEVSAGRCLDNVPELRSLSCMDLLIRGLSAEMTSGSLILIKGSRGMRMERIVEALNQDENKEVHKSDNSGNSDNRDKSDNDDSGDKIEFCDSSKGGSPC